MCMTEYIKERAERHAIDAANKIDFLTGAIASLIEMETRAKALSRATGIVVLLMDARASLLQEQAAAFRVIEESSAIQASLKEVGAAGA